MRKQIQKYWKTAAMAASSYTGDSPLFLVDYLLRLLRVLVLLSIWRSLLAGRGTVSGMTLDAVLTYTLVAEVFAAQLSPRTDFDSTLWTGAIVARLLQPLGVFGQFSAELFGRWLFEFVVFSGPLLLLAPLLGVSPLPASAAAGGLFALSLALAIAVGLAVEFVFGGLLVWKRPMRLRTVNYVSAVTQVGIGLLSILRMPGATKTVSPYALTIVGVVTLFSMGLTAAVSTVSFLLQRFRWRRHYHRIAKENYESTACWVDASKEGGKEARHEEHNALGAQQTSASNTTPPRNGVPPPPPPIQRTTNRAPAMPANTVARSQPWRSDA